MGKGKVEIISRSQALFKDEKVTPSQADLLKIMNIKPFLYGIKMVNAYDKEFFEPYIIEIDDNQIVESFSDAVSTCAAVGLGLNVTSELTIGYEIANAVKQIYEVAVVGYD